MSALIRMAGVAVLASTLASGARAVDQQTVEVKGQMAPPTRDCRPEYPAAALRAQAQGVTTLAFHVSAAGAVTQVDIVKSSGPKREHRLLDHAAALALAHCPITPATDDKGLPIDSIVEVHYTWRLE